MRPAILLIAHGSRRAAANAELEWIAMRLRERLPHWIIEHAYLEIAEPTIPQGIARCVAQGAAHVILTPYFLSAGRHVQEDLEAARRAAGAQYPHVRFSLARALGPHELLVDLLVLRVEEVMCESTNAAVI
ncbi:MAG: CbiX/SirB N-terminal domain-containing protein [Gemmatales bacterium]|nr:CbiX/SirB N-terminal domain-containing protein [Gemmatales bacterium]MDW7993133.1 CbiX/SirB N-terminal domain-containing protein [Gemmatales bacterium]